MHAYIRYQFPTINQELSLVCYHLFMHKRLQQAAPVFGNETVNVNLGTYWIILQTPRIEKRGAVHTYAIGL